MNNNDAVKAQRTELTKKEVFCRVADSEREADNKGILLKMADAAELRAGAWRSHTGKEARPYKGKALFYAFIIRHLGITFGIRLMDKELGVKANPYKATSKDGSEAEQKYSAEKEQEEKSIAMLSDKPLEYLGAIVLGLNDSLVEMTGILAGLTLGIKRSSIIAAVGIITGIAASLSMMASEYLSVKTDSSRKIKPVRSSIYTGIAYIITVVALILPYMVMDNVFIALLVTILVAITIIGIFNYYASVAKSTGFRRHFSEMVLISLGVATISFLMGLIVNRVFHINV